MLLVGLLIFVGAFALLLRPKNTTGPVLRLNIVKQTLVEGKRVVFFRVNVADGRRIQLVGAQRLCGDRKEDPSQFPNGFWAPSQGSPLGSPQKGSKEFGVLAPTNASVWRLKVTVWMESASTRKRFDSMRVLWTLMRKRGSSVYSATKASWQAFYTAGSEALESKWVTNSVLRDNKDL